MGSPSNVNLVWKGSSNNDTAGTFLGLHYSNSNPTLARYTAMRLTTGYFTYWYAGYAFYRASDLAETNLSPMSSTVVYSRWPYKVTAGVPPTGTVVRVYVNQSGTAIANSRLQATLGTNVTTFMGTSFNAAGANPKVTSTFPSAVASSIQSQQTITQTISVTSTSGSASLTGNFQQYMVGRPIAGTGIPANATIVSVNTGASAVISANATASGTVTATLTLPKLEIRGNGYARISELERVIISSTTDADRTAGNQPALRIGNVDATHLRIDNNEILAMAGDTTQGTLTLNAGGTTAFGQGTLNNVAEIANTSAPIVLNLQQGRLRLVGAGSFAGKLYTDNGTGAALVFQGPDIKVVQEGYTATDTNSTNTRQLWCDRVTAYRAYNNVSDMRVKKDIVDVSSAFSKVKALKPRKYKRSDYPETDERFEMEEYGFIAQEVLQVLPEAVTDMGDGLMGLQYQTIFTVGMAALVELEARVAELEKTKK
jgi:hypothetical protein